MPEKEPIDAYLKIQGKFKFMGTGAAAESQNNVERSRHSLVRKCRDAHDQKERTSYHPFG